MMSANKARPGNKGRFSCTKKSAGTHSVIELHREGTFLLSKIKYIMFYTKVIRSFSMLRMSIQAVFAFGIFTLYSKRICTQ